MANLFAVGVTRLLENGKESMEEIRKQEKEVDRLKAIKPMTPEVLVGIHNAQDLISQLWKNISK